MVYGILNCLFILIVHCFDGSIPSVYTAAYWISTALRSGGSYWNWFPDYQEQPYRDISHWLSSRLRLGPINDHQHQSNLLNNCNWSSLSHIPDQGLGQLGLYELPTTISKRTQKYIFVIHNVIKCRLVKYSSSPPSNKQGFPGMVSLKEAPIYFWNIFIVASFKKCSLHTLHIES